MVKTDTELATEVKLHKSNDALKELIARHSPLCYSFYNRYSNIIRISGKRIEDVQNDKDLTIYKAANSFNYQKGSRFSTWLGHHLKFQCLNAINKEDHLTFIGDERVIDLLENQQTPARDCIEEYFEVLRQMKDKRIEKIFRYRYVHGEDWRTIGKRFKRTGQRVIDLHDKGIETLRKNGSKFESFKIFVDKTHKKN